MGFIISWFTLFLGTIVGIFSVFGLISPLAGAAVVTVVLSILGQGRGLVAGIIVLFFIACTVATCGSLWIITI